MKHTLITPPAIEPVSLSEMREYLGITQADDTARDAIITARITAARQMVEDKTGRALITQTLTGWAMTFEQQMPLIGNLQSVTSIQYTNTAAQVVTLDPSAYIVDTVGHCVLPSYGNAWPSVLDVPSAVRVQYVAGYGSTADDVPQILREAIKFIVGQWENYQATIEGGLRPMTIPAAAWQLMQPEVDYRGLARA
jgi:uncharacterized phiE125 gp8 family phage protein